MGLFTLEVVVVVVGDVAFGTELVGDEYGGEGLLVANTFARLSAPAEPIRGRDGWKATAITDMSYFFLCAAISDKMSIIVTINIQYVHTANMK